MPRERQVPPSVTPKTNIPDHTTALQRFTQTPTTAAQVQQLQRAYGNRAVAAHLAPTIQRKNTAQVLPVAVSDAQTISDLAMAEVKPIEKKVLHMLGGSRAYLKRDKRGLEVRNALKAKARSKAAEEINTKVNTDVGTAGKTDAEKDYIKMKAQGEAYKKAKEATQTVIEREATSMVRESVGVGLIVRQVQRQLDDQFPQGGQHYVIEKAMRDKVKKLVADIYDVVLAISITKATQKQDSITAGQVDEFSTKVETEVTNQNVASTAVTKAIDAPNINAFFRAIAKIIDMEVPNVGDKCKITVSGKVWVPKSPFYFMATFISDIKREKLIKARGEMLFGVGVGNSLLDLNLQAGLYAETNGETSDKVMELFSYGAYRGLKAKGLSTFPNAAWGEGGDTVKLDGAGKAIGKNTKEEEAEMWAAVVEQSALSNDDAYAEIGGLAKLKGTAGDDKIAKGEMELMASTGRRYNKKSLGATAGKGNKSSSDLKKANKGEERRNFQGQVKISSDWIGQGMAKVKTSHSYDAVKQEYVYKEVEVELEGQLGGMLKNYGTEGAQKIMTAVLVGIDSMFIGGGVLHRFLAEDAKGNSANKGKTKGETGARATGNVLHSAGDLMPMVAVAGGAIDPGLCGQIFGGVYGQRNHIGVNWKYVKKNDGGATKPTWELNFFLGKLQKIKVGAALAAEFKTDIETSHRFFQLKSDGSKQFT